LVLEVKICWYCSSSSPIY